MPAPGDEGAHGGSYPDRNYNFTSLGVRIPTVLISPWIKKGTVVSAPPKAQQPTDNSAYDLTSILATVRKLLPEMHAVPPLTKRDAWAATFEHVVAGRTSPRTDTPSHLVQAPQPTLAPAVEAARPLNDLQEDIAAVRPCFPSLFRRSHKRFFSVSCAGCGRSVPENLFGHLNFLSALKLARGGC